MLRPDKILFETEVTASGGRDGIARAASGREFALRVPKELGGPGGEGTNPEELFAAGYAACFLGAVKLVARTRKIALPQEPSVTARVGLGPVEPGYALAVSLTLHLPGVEGDLAREIMEGAHARCPYSHATRGNIDVSLAIG